MESLSVTFQQSNKTKFTVEVIKGETFGDVKAKLINQYPELMNQTIELIYNGEILSETTEAYTVVTSATVLRLRIARRNDVPIVPANLPLSELTVNYKDKEFKIGIEQGESVKELKQKMMKQFPTLEKFNLFCGNVLEDDKKLEELNLRQSNVIMCAPENGSGIPLLCKIKGDSKHEIKGITCNGEAIPILIKRMFIKARSHNVELEWETDDPNLASIIHFQAQGDFYHLHTSSIPPKFPESIDSIAIRFAFPVDCMFPFHFASLPPLSPFSCSLLLLLSILPLSFSPFPPSLPLSIPLASVSLSHCLHHSIHPPFLPSSLPSILPSILPCFLSSFLPSFLPSSLPPFLPSSFPSFHPPFHPPFLPSSLPSSLPPFLPSSLPFSLPSCSLPSRKRKILIKKVN